jgi:hypothetical protein
VREAALSQPAFRRFQKRCEDLGIVDAFEKAEVACVVPVSFQVRAIDLGTDPADRRRAATGRPKGGFRLVEIGVFAGIEVLQSLERP